MKVKSKNLRNLSFILGLFFVLLIQNILYTQSLYYWEQFNNWTSYTANGWNSDYRYGRDGVLFHGPRTYPAWSDNTPSTNEINAGQMRIYGRGNNGDLDYNNYWVGRVTKFVPQNCPSIGKSIQATPAHPFGFQIVRYFSLVDPNEELQGTSDYHQCDINIWLIQNEPSRTNEWDTLDNFIYFMEKMVDTWTSSRFGYFSGAEFLPNVSSLTGADGSTFNFATADWQIAYDDADVWDNPPNSLYDTPTTQNSNRLGIRITHNGSSIKIYLNPNPIDGDGFTDLSPNAWFLLGSINVGWNTNLAVMIGHETLYYLSESQEAIYDNLLIRSVASNVVAEISPTKVRKNSLVDFTLEIRGTFTSNDSGIGEIKIIKPAGYGLWDYANINVYTNNIVMTKNSGSDTNPVQGTVSLITNGNELKIRFCKTSGSVNDIIDYYNNKVIKVEFSLTVPPTADATGSEFEVYINNEKYSDTGGDITLGGSVKYATTGWQKAIPGDAGTNVNTSLLLVKVYNDPQAFAGITVSPTPVYEDNSGTESYTYYYEFSTTGVTNAPDISKIIINYPAGVNITPSDVSSLLLQDDVNNIYVSNNQIIIDYYNDPAGKLPSPDGYDRITIVGYGTPDLPLNTLYSNYSWPSVVSSEGIVIGSSNQFTTTNSIYPSQKIRVIIVSPEISCAVDLTNGVGVPRVSNEKKSNTFIYSVFNTGTTKILKLKIEIPDVFTNAFNFSSDILGTNISFVTQSNILYLDYLANGTNIPAGTNNNVDNITMRLVHNRDIADPVTNVDVVAYADNGNTEGWVKGTPTIAPGWSIEITPPDPKGESQIQTNVIFTTLTNVWETNILYYTIYNSGAAGNNLAKSKIYVPSEFEILNVESSHISNDAVNISVNGNIIALDYINDSNGVLKSYIEIPSEKDIVTLTLRHRISQPTNLVFNCKVSNESKTNWAETTAYPGGTKTLTVEYPPVNAKYYVVVDSDPINNIIDAATTTNSLTYVISNSGRPGNRILRAYINIPTTISTNVINIYSSKIVDDGSYAYYDKNTGIIYLNYIQDAGGPLLGNEKDTITFELIDYVTWEGLYDIIASVSNDREFANCSAYPGKYTNIRFEIPDAEASGGLVYKYIYTNTTPKIESFGFKVTNRGKGSNNLKKAKIIFPSLFWGKVISIHSSYLNATSPQPYLIVQNNYAEILYETAGLDLVSGGTDIITITYTNNFSDTNTVIWELQVDNGNGKGYVATGTIPGMTKQMEIIVPVDVSITPTEVYSTSTNIDFSYTIHNGTSGKSRDVLKAKVYIPYPFHPDNIRSYTNTWTGSSLSIISNYIYIDYTGSPLSAGGQDILSINFSKVSNQVTTNALFDCKVDYGYAKVYRDTVTNAGNTKIVSVIYPPADAYAYSEPNNVGKDISQSPYKIYIKNIAGEGNYLYQAKIIPPPFITNITSITSSYIGGNVIYSNNMIILKYYKYGTNIASLEIDTISFIAMDSVNIITQGEWQVEVNNTTNTNGFTTAAVYPGKSLQLSLYQPSYNAYFYISPNNIDSTYITNQIDINIKNVSGDSSKINKVRIYIPALFVTNNIKITNNTPALYSVSSNYVLIDYSAVNNAILPDSSDIIQLSIIDTIDEGYTNTYWVSTANYDSSGLIFITNNVTPGKSVSNYFVMPAPVYTISYNVDEIYTTTTNFNTIITITNKGTGTHKLKQIDIIIPQTFTNGVNLSKLNSIIADSKQLLGNRLILQYTNFTPSKYDVITLQLLNTNRDISSDSFTVIVSNGYKVATNQLNVEIETPASASITPSEVYSTAYSNNFTLYIKNDGSGIKPIYYSKVYLPVFITNVRNIVSIKGGTVLFTNNRLEIDYSASPIADGDYDTIYFTAIDSLTLEQTNIIIDVAVSNSFGNSAVTPGSTNNLKVLFTVPAPEAYAYLYNPLYIYTTKDTNYITIKITNYGTDLNRIERAVINLPAGMQIEGSVQSSHISDTNNIKVGNNTSVTLYYSADPNGALSYTEIDYVTMKISDTYTEKTNVLFTVYGYNGKIEQELSPALNTTLELRVKYPEEPSKFYVRTPEVLYTIDTNVWITFHIINSSYDNDILKLYITFYTDIFEVRKIGSQYTGSNNFTIESNYLVIDYSAGSNLPPRAEEDIRINVVYHYSNATNLLFKGKAVFYGNLDKVSLTNGGNQDTIPMVISDFGRIVGTVIPKGFTVTAELVTLNNQNATNRNGEYGQASIDPDTGYYMIDWVIPGTYNIRFISEDFRVTYHYNVVVYSNKYTVIPQVRLRNRLLNNDELVDRRITADDEISYVLFPAGSILEDFYLDIYVTNINGLQTSAISGNSSIFSPANPSSIKVFDFRLQDADENDIDEIELKDTVTIVLHYTDAEIAAQGWNEDSLAIYYWKANTGEWIRLGGKIDKVNNTITVTVNYLYTAYAIFGSKPVEYVKSFGDLRATRIFTPIRGGSEYSKFKVSFIFKTPVNEFKFKIYDLKGRLIYEKEYTAGPYYNAVIPWDGKDNNGYYVKSGIYIYQIEISGNEYYRGTVLVAK